MKFHDYYQYPVLTAAALGAGFTAGTIVGPVPLESMSVALVQVTGAACSLKFEYSSDKITWYQETFGSITGGVETDTLGTHTLTAVGNYRLGIPILDQYIRVSAAGAGSTVTLFLVVGA